MTNTESRPVEVLFSHNGSASGISGTGYTAPANLQGADAQMLIAGYYDSASFRSLTGFAGLPGIETVADCKGLLLGTVERVLEPVHKDNTVLTDPFRQYIHTVYRYDSDDNPVYTASSTVRPGEFISVTTARDVAGNPLSVNTTLHHPDGTAEREVTSCQYDRIGRPQRTISTIVSDGPLGTQSQTIGQTYYNRVGLPYYTKGAAGTTTLSYDIISRPVRYTNDAFTENLTYSPAGLISGRQTTPHGSVSEIRAYTYDGAGRLTDVSLVDPSLPSTAGMVSEAAFAYDLNSNITALTRSAARHTDSASPGSATAVRETVDDLTMTYAGNRLVKVTDHAEAAGSYDSYDFHDGADTGTECTYDLLGRLTSDSNRGITSIEWNAASQPQCMVLDNGDHLEYLYTASGTLLAEYRRRYDDLPVTSPISTSPLSGSLPAGGDMALTPQHLVTLESRRYAGPFELQGDSITRVNIAGGYWTAEGLHAYITDWQGNVRAVRRAADGVIEQINDYYPYGLPSRSVNPTVNPYKYSQKRFETRSALNLSYHGARLMLNDQGRFASPDPLAELTPGISPYAYCAADPSNLSDPSGLGWYYNGENYLYDPSVVDQETTPAGATYIGQENEDVLAAIGIFDFDVSDSKIIKLRGLFPSSEKNGAGIIIFFSGPGRLASSIKCRPLFWNENCDNRKFLGIEFIYTFSWYVITLNSDIDINYKGFASVTVNGNTKKAPLLYPDYTKPQSKYDSLHGFSHQGYHINPGEGIREASIFIPNAELIPGSVFDDIAVSVGAPSVFIFNDIGYYKAYRVKTVQR